MKKIILLTILLIPFKSFAIDKWETEDTILQSTFILLTTIDWLQSRSSLEYRETLFIYKPIYNTEYPSKKQFDTLIPIGILLHTGVSIILPKQIRPIWQFTFIILEGNAIINNYNIGIRIKF